MSREMSVESVQAAELRIIRAFRLIAITLGDSMDDMCRITSAVHTPTPLQSWEVEEAGEKSWTNIARLLQLTLSTISNIHDNRGPAFEGFPNLVDHCEAAIKEWEEPRRIARAQQFREKLKENERQIYGNK